MQNLKDLNEKQTDAVINTEGPILVLAGAGTGKTTVITSRIAYIVQNDLASLDEILAVTFTNKAAGEMKERVYQMVGSSDFFESWIGTFHSICLKILKLYTEAAGLRPNFMIADMSDQKQMMKRVLEQLGISEKVAPLKLVFAKISKLKDDAVDINETNEISKYNQAEIDMTRIYPKYQQMLQESNLLDFDDLILFTLDLLRKNPEILLTFQKKFKYVLVDEYQDTNKSQYNLISMFVGERQNICCVGDDDQSIYSWRGADVGNILNFQKYFKDAKIVTLNNNYRSTQAILDIAKEIISNNTKRYEKDLIANLADQRSVKIIDVYDDRQESDEVASIIKNITHSGETSFNKDVAVLVRTTSQMRSIEEAFIKRRIPYKIIGGVRFYERKEIKDAIAYIKLLLSDSDLVSLERIINVPKRGIGEKTFNSIVTYAAQNNLPMLRALDEMSKKKGFSDKINEQVLTLIENIKNARQGLASGSLPIIHIVSSFLEQVGYMQMLKLELENDPSYEKKIDNVEDLINNIARYSNLIEFFEHIALVSDQDNIDESDLVNIMTIHASKGLEFETVILPGWEEDLFPNRRVVEENRLRGLEEERRLAYVAITRAKRNLFILSTKVRFSYGKYIPCMKSSFITDISQNFYEYINKTSSASFDSGYQKTKFDYNIHQKKQYYTSSDDMKVIQARYSGKKNNNLEDYVKSKPSQALASTNNSSSRVSHEKYGNGEILKQFGKFAEVKFDSGQRMVLDMSFLVKLD